MFCDEVTVHFITGRGGNGCISFRREKFIPRGGPSGGDGGNGGSIYLEADENINTLAEFNAQKVFRAQAGEHGYGKKQAGADASDLILKTPVGTMVFNEKKKVMLGDLKDHKERLLIAQGGRGGYGNAHFASSTRQAPRFAELGEPGEEKKCVLELKLVADVGIIGLPSVGKSTLLSRISNARPKIADYHFTTLVPNLGLVTLQKFGGNIRQNFLACDLPGLIEGASKGKGLGIKFLKHVTRNRALIHMIDLNSLDPSKDYKTIIAELKTFDRNLARKPSITAFNKIDMADKEAVKDVICAFQKKHRSAKKAFPISCVTGSGIKELMFAVWTVLQKTKKETPKETAGKRDFAVFRPHLEDSERHFEIKLIKAGKKKKHFLVTGRRIEQIVVMTDFKNPEAVARVYDVFEKMGIHKELRRNGARFGDEILIKGQNLIYRWE